MAMIGISPTEVRSRAAELRELNGRFKIEVENLNAKETGMAQKWKGEAKEKYHSVFQMDVEKMNVLQNTIEQYIVTLENIAAKLEEADRLGAATVNV